MCVYLTAHGMSGRVDKTCRSRLETNLSFKASVALTTGGGLYRYRLLHDLVEVSGAFMNVLWFVFAEGWDRFDWFGEKLNEAHVAATLREVFDSLELKPAFASSLSLLSWPTFTRQERWSSIPASISLYGMP